MDEELSRLGASASIPFTFPRMGTVAVPIVLIIWAWDYFKRAKRPTLP